MKSSRKIGTVPDYPAEIGGVPAATRGIQLCLIAVFALALTSCAPQKAPQNSQRRRVETSTRLLPVVVNKRYGFIDQTGNVVASPDYFEVSEYSGGFARVCVIVPDANMPLGLGVRWGLLDSTGGYAVEPRFDSVRDLSDGMLAVESVAEVDTNNTPGWLQSTPSSGKWGYVDPTGKMVIEPRYDDAMDFSEGMAAVRLPKGLTGGAEDHLHGQATGKWGYIDKSGAFVTPTDYDSAGSFSNGLAIVKVGGAARYGVSAARYGCVDREGKLVVSLQMDSIGRFQDGFAVVKLKSLYGYVDMKGRYLCKPQFTGADGFHDGLARVTLGRKTGLIDTAGRVVLAPRFDNIEGFHEGIAMVSTNCRYGYINKVGRMLIKPQFDYGLDFSEGLAGICIGQKWGFIDSTGKVVIRPQFDRVRSFSNGLAAAGNGASLGEIKCLDGSERTDWIGGSWGYVNRKGEWAIEPRFRRTEDFHAGLAAVLADTTWGLIRADGQLAFSPQFYAVEFRLKDSVWETLSGIIDTNGTWIMRTKLGQEVGYFKDGIAGVSEDDSHDTKHGYVELIKQGYIDRSGEWIWKPTR